MDQPSDPYPLPASPPPSLFDRLGEVRGRRRVSTRAPASRADRIKAGSLFALLIAGPLASIVINHSIAAQSQGEIAQAQARQTPVETAAARVRMGRDVLAAAFARPAPVAVLTRLAQLLPGDARVARIGQREGALQAEIATSDPDRLRAALRRDPVLKGLRETGQRQGDGVIVVAFAQAR